MGYGDNMGVMNIVLPDEVERKLRVAVAERGGKKGDLSGTVEEAILAWLQRNDREQGKSKR
jgi:Arc/MetJ-type ribon-helix-helix transcriptional regulator